MALKLVFGLPTGPTCRGVGCGRTIGVSSGSTTSSKRSNAIRHSVQTNAFPPFFLFPLAGPNRGTDSVSQGKPFKTAPREKKAGIKTAQGFVPSKTVAETLISAPEMDRETLETTAIETFARHPKLSLLLYLVLKAKYPDIYNDIDDSFWSLDVMDEFEDLLDANPSAKAAILALLKHQRD